MRKYSFILLAAVMAFVGLSACGSREANPSEEKLQIVTTIFPEYDWVNEILGDRAKEAEVTMLLDSGVDLHNYQPTSEDLLKIANCDLFIYVGGESDEWVEDALQEAVNADRKVLNLLEVLGDAVKEEEIVEGMEAEDEEEEEIEYDEHVWLSLKNAKVLCSAMADALAEIDQDNANEYETNAAAYNEKLTALDAQYQSVIDAAAKDTLLFADRFPFRYLAEDYGLSYYAAFAGCSAETEASFETIVFLSRKVDEWNLHTVMILEKSNQKIAQTVVENTQEKNQQILTLDSMQSTTQEEILNGATYLSIMESNCNVLEDALK